MKQKLFALDAFFIEKLKLSENDPPIALMNVMLRIGYNFSQLIRDILSFIEL